MNNLALKNKIDQDLTKIHNKILEIFNNELDIEGLENLHDSALYHFNSRGKMIRPGILLVMSYDLGLDNNVASVFALSLELIHNYSLIHDDLPCMDDDDYRRGQLSVHRKFDESSAVLLGDYFLNKSIEYISDNLKNSDIELKNILKAIDTLYSNSGSYGMLGGQFLDLNNKFLHSETNVIKMYELKTAALFKSAFLIPGILVKLDDSILYDIETLGKDFGILFQLLDDFDDKEEDEEKTTIFNFKNEDDVNEIIKLKISSVENIMHKYGLNLTEEYLKYFYEKKS